MESKPTPWHVSWDIPGVVVLTFVLQALIATLYFGAQGEKIDNMQLLIAKNTRDIEVVARSAQQTDILLARLEERLGQLDRAITTLVDRLDRMKEESSP